MRLKLGSRSILYSPDKIVYVKVSTARSKQGYTMLLHTYNPQHIFLPNIKSLHLAGSKIGFPDSLHMVSYYLPKYVNVLNAIDKEIIGDSHEFKPTDFYLE